ncbi:MAP7 domain-containing protein 3 isoform X2 [Rousettus aegyptiacus]|uniref:MAP7 domain-containing protein 3 isoform X2 n=1 Tax=Rousettus aegyptiacus TaxID=9407 RepID=UPI00168CCC4D|nr:MAP7 domain-containing protein 3 isoform X2 [Rousettus aegyptiacus]
MAERVIASNTPSLRGLRERIVAAAHAIAQERRNQSGFSSLQFQSSNTKSAFKPVLDGSVLKNDLKQKLAKERREERRRQQDANKEIQLLEKERRSRIRYEKQMEEKKRKLREQKEKDEQRRISAEEKRKQKLREEREKFRAVLSRTLERSNRVDQRQKKWSWEGSTTVNSGSKTVNKRSVSTEKTEQETSGLQKQTTVSSAGLQNSIAKKKTEKRINSSFRRHRKLRSPTEEEQMEGKAVQQLYTELWENDLIMSLIVPAKAAIARSKSAASLPIPGKDTPDNHSPVLRYRNMPLLSRSSDELKNAVVFSKSTGAMPAQEKVETPLKARVEAPPEVSMKAPPKVSVKAPPEVSVEAPPEVSVEEIPDREEETSPEGSLDVSLGSVDPSPEVSMDSSPEVSMESSPRMAMETLSETSMDIFIEASMETIPEESMEAISEESKEVPSVANVEVPSKSSPEVNVETPSEVNVERSEVNVVTSSEVKVRDTTQKLEVDKQTSNLVTKKRLSSHIPCYKWPSSASGWRPSSPISANRQIQRNHSPSLSPTMSKQSTESSPSYKVNRVQRTLFTQSTLSSSTTGKKKAVSKITRSSESVNQKHVTYEESGNKSTPGTMNAEEAKKILGEKRRLAREQRQKEERLQKEIEQRKNKDVVKKVVEGQEEDDGQQKKITKKKECQDQKDQKVLLQEEDAKRKTQEEADKCKKEHERIMLQNLQERLERKKRIEEIMKRTRKTDSNASKAAETSSSDIYEENEADDEDESESDDRDSFDDLHPSAFINGMGTSKKVKTKFRNVKRNTPKLVFLDASSSQIHKETQASFKSDMKNFRQNVKDSLTQAKDARPSTKRMTNRVAKPRKTIETSNITESSRTVHSREQDWICEKIQDTASETETLISNILPDSPIHHLKSSTPFHQSQQTPLEGKTRSKSESSQSDI